MNSGARTPLPVISAAMERDADLLAKGYVTQHVTWRQMVTTPRAVARRITATLAEWSPEALGPAQKYKLSDDLGANTAL